MEPKPPALRAATTQDANATTPAAPASSETQPASQPGAELPQQFGRYRILKMLGQGGMGAVYLAHDSQLDRAVALKVPTLDDSNPTAKDRFLREARSAATLHHPNICPVFDVGQFQGFHYLTMAFIEGKPLSEYIKRDKPLPIHHACLVVRKLALALHDAHAKGIIHRDLKPANVMIDHRKEPVLMDFGLAGRTNPGDSRLTQSGAIMGTPAYMAPEQVAGDTKAIGPTTDIYSLGVILYELLTCRRPFEGPTALVLGLIMVADPEKPAALRPEVSPDLEAVCVKAMARKKQDRYQSMTEFAAALTPFCRSRPPAGRPAPAEADNTVPDPPLLAAAPPGTPASSTTVDTLGPADEWPAPRKRRQSMVPWILGGLAVVLFGVCGLGVLGTIILRIETKAGTVILEIDQKDAEVFVDGDKIKIVPRDKDAILIEAKEGKHQLKVSKAGFEAWTSEVTFKTAQAEKIRITLKPLDVAEKKPDNKPTVKEDKKAIPEFTALFNGKDLTGWKLQPDARGSWSVVDGYLTGSGDQAHLFTERDDFEDFHLRVEARVNDGGNSGVYFRTALGPGFPKGYEAQIAIGSGDPVYKTGSLFGFVRIAEDLVKSREWFMQEVIARGNHIVIKLNGKVVVDFIDDKSSYRRGHLALQQNGAKTVVEFKRIEIKELRPDQGAALQTLFNGKDFTGWKVPVGDNRHWKIVNGVIDYDARSEAKGAKDLFTEKSYKNFTLLIDWRFKTDEKGYMTKVPIILPDGTTKRDEGGKEIQVEIEDVDSGIYLRGNVYAQVNIWMWPCGSGEIWGYRTKPAFTTKQKAAFSPKKNMDRPRGEWNTMEITLKGDRLWVKLNGETVIENAPLQGVPEQGSLALKHHGTWNAATRTWSGAPSLIQFKNIYLQELPD